MAQKYILTGAPGSGKSSILLELERRGEHIIREAAEDVIKRYQAKGIEKPWELPNFQGEILDLQIQRENRIPQEAKRVFIDRGIYDGLAYLKEGSEIYKKIKEDGRNYSKIFFIGRLQKTETNKTRREDDLEAALLENKLQETYLQQGYELFKIPQLQLEERAELILNWINSRSRNGQL